MDPLSGIFSLLTVQSALTARIELRGPWALRFPEYRHVKFMGVLEGQFWLWFDDGSPPLKLETGDFYLMTRGLPYCVGSDPTLTPEDGRAFLARHAGPDGIVRSGDSGQTAIATGGRFTFEGDGSDLLLNLLPPLVHVQAGAPGAAPLRAVLELLRLESAAALPGASVVSASLASLILMQILRAQLATAVPAAGWLGALADPRIGKALSLMHAQFARCWKVEELASEVAMSRTAFAERFRRLVGVPPLAYLIDWRMSVAGAALKTGASLSQVAEHVGYGSEAAFSAAFKRATGQSPGQYRSRRAGQQVPSVDPERRILPLALNAGADCPDL